MNWTEARVLKIFVQLVSALNYVHSKNVIHRDIKGKNTLLFDNDMVKLCDFGVAKVGETALTMIGDLGFMAKEVSDNQAGYTKEVDIYSLGIILYTLIFHERFKSKVEDEVV